MCDECRLRQGAVTGVPGKPDLQGGIMSPAEVQAFERLLGCRDAVMLRLWDDEAKTPNAAVPPLAKYQSQLELLLTARLRR